MSIYDPLCCSLCHNTPNPLKLYHWTFLDGPDRGSLIPDFDQGTYCFRCSGKIKTHYDKLFSELLSGYTLMVCDHPQSVFFDAVTPLF